MKQLINRIFSIMVCSIFALSLTGCTKQQVPSGATLIIDLEHSYKGEQISIVEDHSSHASKVSTGNDQILSNIAGHLIIQHGNSLYAFDQVNNAIKQLELPDVSESYYSIMPASNKGITVIQMKLNDDGTSTNYFHEYDYSCKCIASGLIPQNVFADPQTDICCRDTEGFWYGTSANFSDHAQIKVYADGFQFLKAIDLGSDKTIDRVLIGNDGCLYLILTEASGQSSLYSVDREKGLIVQVLTKENINRELKVGNSVYPFTYSDLKGMYGIRDDGTEELIIDWDASDLDSTRILSPFLLEDGRVAVDRIIMSGAVSSGTEQWILEKRSKKELECMTILTLSAVGQQAYGLSEAISDYNRQSENVKIVLYNYDKQNTQPSGVLGISQFQKDMIDGKIADIICTDQLQTDLLIDKNVFLDLSSFIASDPSITEDNYYINFFDAFRHNGALPFIGFSYTLRTTLAKKEQFDGGLPKSPSEYMQCLSQLDESTQPFFDVSSSDILSAFCTDHLDVYVDFTTADCDFETREFRQLLELASKYHDKHAVWNYTDGDPNTLQRELIANNQVLFSQITVATPLNWHDAKFFLYQNDPTVIIGYPVDKTTISSYFIPEYTLGINSESKYQEEAWDFFKYLLSEPVQRQLSSSLPVCRTVLQESMQDAIDPHGKHSDRVFWDGENEITSGNATVAEMDELEQQICNTTHINCFDTHIQSIIEEESSMYFYGDQSLDTTCSHIQSRVKLYLSEKE